MLDRIKAVVIGHAVGDALGVPVEFCDREELKDKPITEIAYECGFSTSSYFIMKFKEKNGIPPLGFRKKFGLMNNK